MIDLDAIRRTINDKKASDFLYCGILASQEFTKPIKMIQNPNYLK